MIAYQYYAYTVVHQWALINGWSGANSLSYRAWCRLPAQERKDFQCMILAGGEI